MANPQRDLTGVGEIQALLGRGTRFDGLLTFEGRVRVDGDLKGEIRSEGLLVLGDGSNVDATIEVGTLIVRGGTLRGSVIARELIEIHEGAKVHADITAPEIDIAKGSLFDGRCTMTGTRTSDPGEGV